MRCARRRRRLTTLVGGLMCIIIYVLLYRVCYGIVYALRVGALNTTAWYNTIFRTSCGRPMQNNQTKICALIKVLARYAL